MLVGLRQGVLDALGKAEPNLLVDGALDKRLLRVQVRQSHVVHPLGPFPGEAKVAQMVREPIEEAIAQLEIQSDDVPVQVPDRTSQARSDGRRRQLAGLRQDGVVVDELVLGSRQLEELGEDSVDCHIFGLPRRLRWLYVAKPIKGGGSSGKGPGSEVAVQIDKVAGGHIAIEVEDTDCIGKRITDERRGGSRLGGDGLHLLAAVHGKVHIREQGSRTGGEVGGDGDGREGVLGRIVELRLLLQLLDGEFPGLGKEREGPSSHGLSLKLRLKKLGETRRRVRVLLSGLGVVWLNKGLQHVRLGCENLGVVDERCRVRRPFGPIGDHDVWQGEENDLDQLGANSLQPPR